MKLLEKLSISSRLVGLVALLAACAGSGGSTSAPSSTVFDSSVSTEIPTTSARVETTISPTTTSAFEYDAEMVLLGLAEAGLPIGEYLAYTAETDPNEQLGRPGGYTSKVNFHDTRLEQDDEFSIDFGGSIEVFENTDDAAARYTYVDGITKSAAFLAEYHWLIGNVFLRLSRTLTPDEAAQYEEALPDVTRRLAMGEVPSAIASTTTLVGPVPVADPMASPFIDGLPPVVVGDGTDGVLEVVAFGSYDGSSLPIVVRNRTPNTVIRIEVSAVARDQAGILATGSDQGLNPNLVAPGEIAFGYVYFGGADLPADIAYEFTVNGKEAVGELAEFENIRDLSPISHQIRDGRLLGELRNDHDRTLIGPIEAAVICFSSSSEVLDHHSDFTDQGEVDAGAIMPFSIDLFDDPCPAYLFGAFGFED